jgi:hypothetical protein
MQFNIKKVSNGYRLERPGPGIFDKPIEYVFENKDKLIEKIKELVG